MYYSDLISHFLLSKKYLTIKPLTKNKGYYTTKITYLTIIFITFTTIKNPKLR